MKLFNKKQTFERISKEDFDKMQDYQMSIWAFNGGDNDFGGFETENSMKTCRNIAEQKENELKKFVKSLRIKYGIDYKTPIPNIKTQAIWTDGTIRPI